VTDPPESIDPLSQLLAWLADARQVEGAWSDALSLATATTDGRPSVRAVMLRGLDRRGLIFFTDDGSRKGRELATNPVAAAAFLWPLGHREVRLEGSVTRLSDDEADSVFAARPVDRRLPLWAWRQGEPVREAGELRRRLDRATVALAGGDVGRPPYWAGYRLRPDLIEFWEERPDGLHERTLHRRAGATWVAERLAP
jgi:pyridoxamine 5'-phosphate oxidase